MLLMNSRDCVFHAKMKELEQILSKRAWSMKVLRDIKRRKLPTSLHLLALGFLLASRFPNQVDAEEASEGPMRGVALAFDAKVAHSK